MQSCLGCQVQLSGYKRTFSPDFVCLFVFLFTSVHFWQMFLPQAHIFGKCVFCKRILFGKSVFYRCAFSSNLSFEYSFLFLANVSHTLTFLANLSFTIAHFWLLFLLQSHILASVSFRISHLANVSFTVSHFWRMCLLQLHMFAESVIYILTFWRMCLLQSHIFGECVFHNRIFFSNSYIFYKLRRDRVNCFSFSFCFEESDGKRKCHQRGAGVWRVSLVIVGFCSTEQSLRCRDLTSRCLVSVSHPLTAEAVGCKLKIK